METLSLLAVNALNGGGGGGGDVTPDGITTEYNGSEELQANAVIHVNALPSSNIKANSLYHVSETVTYTDEEEQEHTFTMGKLFRYESGEWVSYTTVSGLTEEDYDHLTSTQKNDGSTYVLNGSGHVVRTSTASINDVEVVGDLTGTDLKLVNEDDFVTTPTGKTDGIEIVTPVGTPTSPIVLSEIDDSAAMKYSTVHTSSNDYLNHKFDAIDESLVGKLSIQFVAALPASPTRNTQYYVETADEGVWDIYVVDNSGTVRSMGSTELDTDGFVTDTRKVAGIALSADVSAQQIEDATKSLTSTLTNKTIDADSNTISNVEVDDLKASAVATAVGETPVDTKLTTEKAVSDYAVKKTTDVSKVYGTNSSGSAHLYPVSSEYQTASTSREIATRSAVYNMYTELMGALKTRTITIDKDVSMLPAVVWNNTKTFIMVPAPPLATSFSITMSGTLRVVLYSQNKTVTVTQAKKWGGVQDGYAKIQLTYPTASLTQGTETAYVLEGTLTVQFS